MFTLKFPSLPSSVPLITKKNDVHMTLRKKNGLHLLINYTGVRFRIPALQEYGKDSFYKPAFTTEVKGLLFLDKSKQLPKRFVQYRRERGTETIRGPRKLEFNELLERPQKRLL
jgi:hypothetical protein